MKKREGTNPVAAVTLAVVVLAAIATGLFAVYKAGNGDEEALQSASLGQSVEGGAGTASADLDRQPHTPAAGLLEFHAANVRMPLAYEEREVLVLDTISTWHYAGGVYLSAREIDSHLQFMAVSETGDLLWVADRPATCTGFAVSVGPYGDPIAVLTDTAQSAEALSGVTVSAYDLETGEDVWGPVQVEGPYQGPGLVFAAPPEDFMGESGARTALVAATGQPFDIQAIESSEGSAAVLGEYGGQVLLLEGDSLVLRDAVSQQVLWETSVAAHGWDQEDIYPVVGSRTQGDMVLLAVTSTSRALISLRDGTVVQEPVRDFAFDSVSGTWVTQNDQGLRASNAEGETLWEFAVLPDTTIEALGGALLYLRDGDTVRVHNVISGQLAQGYDPKGEGPVVVPEFIAPMGSALLQYGTQSLLATIEAMPDFVMDEG